MNWYRNIKTAQGLENYLRSLGATDEMIQFIMSQPEEARQHYVNEFRKNPHFNLEQVQQIQGQQQLNPYHPTEEKIAERYPDGMKKWTLVQMRKARNGEHITGDMNTADVVRKPWHDRWAWVVDQFGVNYQLFIDWFNAMNPDIASMTFDQAWQAQEEWHRAAAGEGEGKIFEPTKPELVRYGPQWQNKEWQGWTVQEVRGENDLLVEGNKMNHCVGEYCKSVERGEVKIFSLRDPSNNPKVTIETDDEGELVHQIQGHSNEEPDNLYKQMIKEWISSDQDAPWHINADSEWDSMSQGYHVEEMNGLLERAGTIDEYGLETGVNYDPAGMMEILIQQAQRENRNYREGDYDGDITNSPELLVDLMVRLGPEKVKELEEALYELEQKSDDYNQSHWDFSWFYEAYKESNPPPDAEDYEDGEEDTEYTSDYQDWEEKMHEAEQEHIDEETRKTLPIGFIRDTFKYFNKLREQGVIAPYQPAQQQVA